MQVHGHLVKGAIDDETRCSHYHTAYDRIAIRFYCCGVYFPCYECHAAYGCGEAQVWPREKFHEKAILCGSCGTELRIEAYLNSQYQCPSCEAHFNPNCGRHRSLYFA